MKKILAIVALVTLVVTSGAAMALAHRAGPAYSGGQGGWYCPFGGGYYSGQAMMMGQGNYGNGRAMGYRWNGARGGWGGGPGMCWRAGGWNTGYQGGGTNTPNRN